MWHKDRITSVKPSPLSVMQTVNSVGATNSEGLPFPSDYLSRGAFANGVVTSDNILNISNLRASMAYVS